MRQKTNPKALLCYEWLTHSNKLGSTLLGIKSRLMQVEMFAQYETLILSPAGFEGIYGKVHREAVAFLRDRIETVLPPSNDITIVSVRLEGQKWFFLFDGNQAYFATKNIDEDIEHTWLYQYAPQADVWTQM